MKTHLQPKVLVIFLLLCFFILPLESQSQFRFQLEKISPTPYKVCEVSEKEYSPPSSIIESVQVTLKMSFDSQFNVEKIKSGIFSNGWEIAPEVIDFEKAPNANILLHKCF